MSIHQAGRAAFECICLDIVSGLAHWVEREAEHGPAAVRVLAELMQCANEGTRLSAACAILDHAYGRPSVCTETDNDDDLLFANLFEDDYDEADEAGTA